MTRIFPVFLLAPNNMLGEKTGSPHIPMMYNADGGFIPNADCIFLSHTKAMFEQDLAKIKIMPELVETQSNMASSITA